MKVAITGGIGSGKSALCRCIAKGGQIVYSCDKIYRELLDTNEEFRNKIFAKFPQAKAEDGSLDRKVLSSIVFSDKHKLEKLNGLTHPLIMKELMRRMDEHSLSFAEVPLLFEGGYEKHFDKVVIVLRSDYERIQSLVKRSGLTFEEAQARIKAQANYDKLPLNKYTIVYNNGTVEDLEDKAIFIVSQIQDSI